MGRMFMRLVNIKQHIKVKNLRHMLRRVLFTMLCIVNKTIEQRPVQIVGEKMKLEEVKSMNVNAE